jgi:asparagine synthase (glutamine-hydrolysing)
MCGLCGVLRLDGAAPDIELCERMNAQLVHRGPDGEGTFTDGPVALAMRRLAIIDLPGADQPLHNEDRSLTLVGNGEIYNYRALRRGLAERGHRLATHGDLEPALHLYEEHGLGFAEHLRGMFALALWDAPRRRLVLVRDRYGIKPLYVRQDGARLAFASELGAIAADPGLTREIDPEALWLYLSRNCVPAPRTILRGVQKLEPGHMLVAEGGDVRVRRWYRRPLPAGRPVDAPASAQALANELRWRLEDSVRAHLEADVPVGVFLSGGVDSGTLCALAAGVVSGPVRTFSIGFRERSFDELADARVTAARYGTRHTEEILAPDALSLLPRLVEAYDEPFADSSAVPTFLVSELAARDVKVVLSGEGGDEAFGGYEVYLADRLAPLVSRALPRPVRAGVVEPLVGLLPSSSRRASLDYRAKRFLRDLDLPPLERHVGFKVVLTEDLKAELVRPAHRSVVDPLADLRRHYAEAGGVGPLARLQHVDAMTYLSDDLLTKTDRASMAHSLEARVPFVDDRVLDFAGTLPDGVQVRGLQKKWLLRRAVRPLLPRQVVDGRKRGFSIPAARWLRHDARELVIDHLSAAAVRRQGVFEPAVVERLVREHLDGRVDHSRPLWGLLMFSLWHESAFARPPARTAVGV